MLLLDVDWLVVLVTIVQAKGLRDKENSLSKSELIDNVLELPEEI